MVSEQRGSVPNGGIVARGLPGGNGRRTITRDYHRLINECTEKLLSNPKHTLAMRLRAQSYRMLGEDDAALADYNHLLVLEPRNVDALFYRGTILERQQHIDDAIQCYTAVLQQEPHHHKALYNRAVCFSAKGSFAQAIEDFSAALELDQQASRGPRRPRQQDQQLASSLGAAADAAAAALLHANPHSHPHILPYHLFQYAADGHVLSNATSISDMSTAGWDRRNSTSSPWSTTPQSTTSDAPASLVDEESGIACASGASIRVVDAYIGAYPAPGGPVHGHEGAARWPGGAGAAVRANSNPHSVAHVSHFTAHPAEAGGPVRAHSQDRVLLQDQQQHGELGRSHVHHQRHRVLNGGGETGAAHDASTPRQEPSVHDSLGSWLAPRPGDASEAAADRKLSEAGQGKQLASAGSSHLLAVLKDTNALHLHQQAQRQQQQQQQQAEDELVLEQLQSMFVAAQQHEQDEQAALQAQHQQQAAPGDISRGSHGVLREVQEQGLSHGRAWTPKGAVRAAGQRPDQHPQQQHRPQQARLQASVRTQQQQRHVQPPGRNARGVVGLSPAALARELRSPSPLERCVQRDPATPGSSSTASHNARSAHLRDARSAPPAAATAAAAPAAAATTTPPQQQHERGHGQSQQEARHQPAPAQPAWVADEPGAPAPAPPPAPPALQPQQGQGSGGGLIIEPSGGELDAEAQVSAIYAEQRRQQDLQELAQALHSAGVASGGVGVALGGVDAGDSFGTGSSGEGGGLVDAGESVAGLDPWVVGGHGGMAAALEMSRPSTSSSAASDAVDQNSRHKAIEQFNTRAFALRQQGKLMEAVREYTRALELDNSHFKTLFNRGFTYDRLGELVAAVDDYTQALVADPQSSYAHYNRGITRDRLQDFAGAVEDFTIAIRLEPGNADFYHNRGFAFRKQGLFEAAIQDYTNAVILSPTHCRAYYNRAFCHDRLNHVQQAIDDYTKALEMEPNNATALHNRGSLQERNGRSDLALQDFDRAIAVDPSCAQSYNGRGVLLQNCGRLAEALADLDTAVALMQPPSATLFRNRAQARRERGDHHGAVQDLTRAISLDPLDLLSYSRRAHCFRRMGEYESAIRDYTRAIGLSPSNPKLHTIRAYCYAMIGWYGEAVADYDVVLSFEPSNAHASYNRSIALDKLGGAIDRAAAELSAAAAGGASGTASADRMRQLSHAMVGHSRSHSQGTPAAPATASYEYGAGAPNGGGASNVPRGPHGLPSAPKQAWASMDGRYQLSQQQQPMTAQQAAAAARLSSGVPFGGVTASAFRGPSPARGPVTTSARAAMTWGSGHPAAAGAMPYRASYGSTSSGGGSGGGAGMAGPGGQHYQQQQLQQQQQQQRQQQWHPLQGAAAGGFGGPGPGGRSRTPHRVVSVP